jgi:dGTPase
VALADRIASALDDLDDALQAGAVHVEAVERLRAVAALRRKLGARYRPRASRFMKANAIHRGLTHLLVTAAILASDAAVARWAEREGVTDPASFPGAFDRGLPAGLIGLPRATLALLEDLEGFLEGRVRRGREADRVDGQGRRILLGLFMAYVADPTLLDDHVLLRYRETAGVRYLRDLPRESVEAEIAARYRGDPRFARLLADHLAAMTDAYAVAEHRRLLETGAVPIPSAEQLRRERSS